MRPTDEHKYKWLHRHADAVKEIYSPDPLVEELNKQETNGYPDDNPKTVMGLAKVPLHLVPPSATAVTALALRDGAEKYGPYNWRDHRITASVYMSAAQRHLQAFWDGEEVAEDSGVHHLGHAIACLGIWYDAITLGKCNDDRPAKGQLPALLKANTRDLR